MIGVIRFSESKEYGCKDEFNSDIDLHLVHPDNQEYRWRPGIRKFGWIVERVSRIEEFKAPFPRGIVYASPFEAPVGSEK